MQKKVFSVLLACLCVFFAACGSHAQPTFETAAPQAAEAPVEPDAPEDGQNAVMNFVGVYHADAYTEAMVEADGTENARITVTCAATPWFHHQTVMSGFFDPAELTMTFTDAVRTEYTYKSDGSVDEAAVSYEGGKGSAVFSPEDNTVTITEELDADVVETIYSWGPAVDMKFVSDPDRYASVTAMDKAQIETVAAFNARSAYVSEDWFALADMVRYPITINGTELADPDAFIGFMMGKTVSEQDRDAMLRETTLDMFVNHEGIMLGDGQIWLSDPNFGTDAEPVLEIIALNGIVER